MRPPYRIVVLLYLPKSAWTTESAPSINPYPPPSPPVPSNSTNVTTFSPTPAPNATNATTPAPSMAPPNPTNNNTAVPTLAPTHHPTLAPTTHTGKPTEMPTASPSANVQPPPSQSSILKILGKTLAWLILIALSVLAFGAFMSHRYRIYYFLRGIWYRILRWEGTIWVLRKVGLASSSSSTMDTNLNTIIFDNEMSEGLLFQQD